MGNSKVNFCSIIPLQVYNFNGGIRFIDKFCGILPEKHRDFKIILKIFNVLIELHKL